jgi:hypothetical protein
MSSIVDQFGANNAGNLQFLGFLKLSLSNKERVSASANNEAETRFAQSSAARSRFNLTISAT